jgi:hypothetical protein
MKLAKKALTILIDMIDADVSEVRFLLSRCS